MGQLGASLIFASKEQGDAPRCARRGEGLLRRAEKLLSGKKDEPYSYFLHLCAPLCQRRASVLRQVLQVGKD